MSAAIALVAACSTFLSLPPLHALPALCSRHKPEAFCSRALQSQLQTHAHCSRISAVRLDVTDSQPPDNRKKRAPTESAAAVFLAYSTISAMWYLIGMTIALNAPISNPITSTSPAKRVAARLAGAWAITFAASQVTTPWRGAGAVALTPAVRRILGRVRAALRVGGLLLPAALYMALLAVVFASGLGVLAARELGLAMSLPLLSLGPAPLLSAAALAAFALRDTRAGRSVSPPMLAFSIAGSFGNLGWLPPVSPIYEACAHSALPLSVALGLLSAAAPTTCADADDAAAGGGMAADATPPLPPMLVAFTVGSIGTVLGAVTAFALSCRLQVLPRNAAAAAASLMCATYVGGSANFFGVASVITASSRNPSLVSLLPSLLAADLALMGLYLLGLAAAARSPWLQRTFPEAPSPAIPPYAMGGAAAGKGTAGFGPEEEVTAGGPLGRERVAVASAGTIALTACLCSACAALERACGVPGSGVVALSVTASAVGAALARLRPRLATSIAGPLRNLSLLLGCLFLASIGASARLAELLVAGPAAVLVAATVLLVHCAVLVGGVALCNRSGRLPAVSAATLVLASNANVGGAGTAVAMAGAMGWSRLVAPAAACGALGYSVATAIGVGMHAALS